MNVSRLAGLLLLASALGGCVVAIGNTHDDGRWHDGSPSRRKVQLSPAERDELPVIYSTAELPTVRREHASQLARLSPDTTRLEEFREMFPSSQFVERRETPSGRVDAYSVRVESKCRYRKENYGYVGVDEQWFFFADDRLVKWGSPHAWPR